MFLNGWHFTMLLFSLLFLILFYEIALADEEYKVGYNGIVATDHNTCSKIGLDVLISEGSAVDAAVAATLCLGVKSPWYSGLGGGGFMIVRTNNGSTTVYDMREMAPRGASPTMYNKYPNYNGTGAISIAVPGQLAGLYTAHKKHGKKRWDEVVNPAKNLAEKGFQVSKSLYKKLVQRKIHVMANNELKRTFAPNRRLLLGEGVRLRNLAKTLSLIATGGMKVFYNGSIAKNLVKEIHKEGGILTMDDFKKYKVVERKPLVAKGLGGIILTAPPPASGGAIMIMILKILSAYNDKNMHPSLLMHRTIEALKFALALKMNLGDPGFVNNTRVVQTMISKSNAAKMKNQIKDNQTFEPSHYGSKWSQPQEEGTSHIIVVDKMRNVVTLTTSLNSYKGSQIISPSTGIVLNNQMHDFSFTKSGEQAPAPANFIRPFKRPMSSMAPAIILKDGKVKTVIGAAGGMLIPDAVTEVLLNHVHLRMNILRAVKSPRFYHKLHPNILYYENRTKENSQILDDLKRKGHVLRMSDIHHKTVCQVVIQHLEGPKSGLLVGVGDQRRGGIPAAY